MIGLNLIQREHLNYEAVNIVSKSYCGMCNGLRTNFGTLSSLLINDEAQFVSLLVVAQKKDILNDTTTKCPLFAHAREFPILGDDIAFQYGATIAMLLVGEKLDDNIRDENQTLSKSLRNMLSKQIVKAESKVAQLGFPLTKLAEIKDKQRLTETKIGEPLDYYLEPTGRVVEEIFSRTSYLANASENLWLLGAIGFSVGKIIALMDAIEDFHSDRKFGVFNPIVASYAMVGDLVDIKIIKDSSFLFMKELNSIREALLNLNLYRFEDVIENVLTRGLPERILRSLALFWKNNHWDGDMGFQVNLDLDMQIFRCHKCNNPHYFRKKFSKAGKNILVQVPKNMWAITSSLFNNSPQNANQLGFLTIEDYLFACLFPSIIIENARMADFRNTLENIHQIAWDQNMQRKSY